jgi:hypothetical protein
MSLSKIRFLRVYSSFKSSCQVAKLENFQANISKNEPANTLGRGGFGKMKMLRGP